MLSHVAASLGRRGIPAEVPPPPSLHPAVVRLVDPQDDLAACFTRNAIAAKLHVHDAGGEPDCAARLTRFLLARPHRRLLLTRSPLFDRLGLFAALRSAGFEVTYWDETTLDASYDVDVGITDVWRAVAETGSLVVRESRAHGRAVSLVPAVHVAVVERSQIVPDLIDLMRDIQREGSGSGVVIITGPSKTADIEMNLVTGVHGPGEVEVFLI